MKSPYGHCRTCGRAVFFTKTAGDHWKILERVKTFETIAPVIDGGAWTSIPKETTAWVEHICPRAREASIVGAHA